MLHLQQSQYPAFTSKVELIHDHVFVSPTEKLA